MSVIGVGTFSPSPVFNVPRQYVGIFATHSQWTLESHIDNQFVFNDFSLYNDRIFINLRPSFWPWSSNSYLLDEMVVDAYFYALPATTPIPLDFSLTWVPATAVQVAQLLLLVRASVLPLATRRRSLLVALNFHPLILLLAPEFDSTGVN
jgi:hypothetical protein